MMTADDARALMSKPMADVEIGNVAIVHIENLITIAAKAGNNTIDDIFGELMLMNTPTLDFILIWSNQALSSYSKEIRSVARILSTD